MPDQSDITGVRITGSRDYAAKLADRIAGMPGCSVIKRHDTPLSNRPQPGLRVHLTVLHGYPPVSKVRAWLAANGWEKQPDGPAGAIWVKDGNRAGVPHEGCDDDAVRCALDRIAAAEGMTTGALVAAIHLSQEKGKDGR